MLSWSESHWIRIIPGKIGYKETQPGPGTPSPPQHTKHTLYSHLGMIQSNQTTGMFLGGGRRLENPEEITWKDLNNCIDSISNYQTRDSIYNSCDSLWIRLAAKSSTTVPEFM